MKISQAKELRSGDAVKIRSNDEIHTVENMRLVYTRTKAPSGVKHEVKTVIVVIENGDIYTHQELDGSHRRDIFV